MKEEQSHAKKYQKFHQGASHLPDFMDYPVLFIYIYVSNGNDGVIDFYKKLETVLKYNSQSYLTILLLYKISFSFCGLMLTSTQELLFEK